MGWGSFSKLEVLPHQPGDSLHTALTPEAMADETDGRGRWSVKDVWQETRAGLFRGTTDSCVEDSSEGGQVESRDQ